MSKAVKETLFDHDFSDLEFFSVTGLNDKEAYRREIQNWSSDFHYNHIYMLHLIQGNIQKAKFYLSKIQDESMRTSLTSRTGV